MTKMVVQTEYISEKSDSNLKTYRAYLGSMGASNGTIEGKVMRTARCIRILHENGIETPLEKLGSEEFALLHRTISHTTSIKATNAYCYAFGEYLEWACRLSINPAIEYRINGEFDCDDIARTYAPEFARFKDGLREQGLSIEFTAQLVNEARICLVSIANHYGPIPVECIGVEHFRYLDRNLPLQRVKTHSFLPTLGRFVGMITGHNPFLDFRSSMLSDRFEARVDALDFSEEFRSYIAWLKKRGFRDSSIVSKQGSLMSAFGIIATEFGRCDRSILEEMDEDMLYRLRNAFVGWKESSIRKTMCDLGRFIEFMTGSDPYKKAKMLWNNSDIRRTFIDKQQWLRIIAAADITTRTAILFAGTLGMRLSEIAELRMDDLTEDGKIIIHGKGHGPDGKVCVKNLGKALRTAIEQYKAYRQTIIDQVGDQSEGNFLISDRANRGTPYNAGMLSRKLSRLSKETDIEFSCHTFRRFYATSLYDIGTDVNTLRIMMRHESSETTFECYVNADPRRIKTAEEKLEDELF